MRDEQGFLQAILAAPEEDAPRLVYADWLEEHGATAAERARAEFIRAQCELARLDPDDDRRPALAAREVELLRPHATAWRAGLPPWARKATCYFRRGFVEDVAATVIHFARAGGSLRHTTPLRGILIRKGRLDLNRLLTCPHVLPLRLLEFLNGYDLRHVRDQLRALLGSPQLANLRALNLDEAGIGTEGAKVLARSRHLAGLEELSLADNSLVGADASALARSPHLRRLRVLRLPGNHINARGAAALARLQGLTLLDLNENPLGDRGAEAIASAPALSSVVSLDLSYAGVGRAGLEALVASPHLTGLRHLALGYNDLGDEDAARLISSPLFRRLTRLDLSGNHLEDQTAEALAEASGAGRLRVLFLGAARVGDRGARALAAARGLRRLHRLWLGSNTFGGVYGGRADQALRRTFGDRLSLEKLDTPGIRVWRPTVIPNCRGAYVGSSGVRSTF